MGAAVRVLDIVLAACLAVHGVGAPAPRVERATGRWLGARPWLESRGVSFEGYFTLDSSWIWTAEPAPGTSAVRLLTDAAVAIDLDQAIGWTGVTIRIAGQAFLGGRGDRITGDVQMFDNIDADPFVCLTEVWFQ